MAESLLKKYQKELDSRNKVISKLISKGYLCVTDEVNRLNALDIRVHAPHFVKKYGHLYDKKPICVGERTKVFVKAIDEQKLIEFMKAKKTYNI